MKQNQRVTIALFACLVAWLMWQDRLSWQQSHQHESYEAATRQPDKKIPEITPEERIAKYTLWLAVLTGCLVGVAGIQGYFLLRSDGTARITAESAKRSADAAIALELPIIRAQVGNVGYTDVMEGSVQIKRQLWVSFVYLANIGKTRAFPIELQIGLTVGNALPEIPVFSSKEIFAINVILGAEEREVRLMEFTFDVPVNIYDQLRTKTLNVWFYCNLVYLDFMQNKHDAGFCWKRVESFGIGKFDVDPTPAYNRKT